MIEKMIDKPNDISNEAWTIMTAVFQNYIQDSDKIFTNFSQFDLSDSDLVKYCQELHDKKFVFFTNEIDERSIYMLPMVLGCLKR